MFYSFPLWTEFRQTVLVRPVLFGGLATCPLGYYWRLVNQEDNVQHWQQTTLADPEWPELSTTVKLAWYPHFTDPVPTSLSLSFFFIFSSFIQTRKFLLIKLQNENGRTKSTVQSINRPEQPSLWLLFTVTPWEFSLLYAAINSLLNSHCVSHLNSFDRDYKDQGPKGEARVRSQGHSDLNI